MSETINAMQSWLHESYSNIKLCLDEFTAIPDIVGQFNGDFVVMFKYVHKEFCYHKQMEKVTQLFVKQSSTIGGKPVAC